MAELKHAGVDAVGMTDDHLVQLSRGGRVRTRIAIVAEGQDKVDLA